MLPLKPPYKEGSIITFGGTIGIPPGEPLATTTYDPDHGHQRTTRSRTG